MDNGWSIKYHKPSVYVTFIMKSRILNIPKPTVLAFFVSMMLMLNLGLYTDRYLYKFHQPDDRDNKTTMTKSYSTMAVPSKELIMTTWFIHHKDKMMSDPVLRRFLPRMSINDQLLMLVTLDTFVEICNRANLTYFLWSGSLLGAYRHHGFIPWDDDLDVVIVISDITKTRKALSSHQNYTLFSPKNFQWKFYIKELPDLPNLQFKYPFFSSKKTRRIYMEEHQISRVTNTRRKMCFHCSYVYLRIV